VTIGACEACLARTSLLTRLSGHLDAERKRIWELLALSDEVLIGAVAGRSRAAVESEHAQYGASQAQRARTEARAAGIELICHCNSEYPSALRELRAPPAVLHVAGRGERSLRACSRDAVAVVGARRANAYGKAVARSLGRGIGVAGVTVVSGLAAGIDSEAHRGAVEVRGRTIAVLPGPANRPHPMSNANLHREILRHGLAVSEIAPGTAVRSWMFAARNRLIAALCDLTVVVQATERSGSLLTARAGQGLGRTIGAVPGPVTSPLSAGSHQLLANGAVLIRDTQDVLDAVFGAGVMSPVVDTRPDPTPGQAGLLSAIADGLDTASALVGAGAGGERCLVDLAALELAGRITRGPGGRLAVIP
jgi:DNA processing protein